MHRLPLAFLALAFSVPGSAYAQSGGPNTFGYAFEPAAFDYVPPPSTVTPLVTSLGQFGDDQEALVALPWSFPYYGVAYTQILVSDNGGIRFTAGDVDFLNDCLPSFGGSAPDLMPFWEDLDPTTGGSIYAWEDAGNGRFVVSWEQILHYTATPQGVTFQVHLEPSGAIEFQWADTSFGDVFYDLGQNATVGIQDPGAADPLEWSCLAPDVVAMTATRFSYCADGDGDGDEDVACGGGDCDDADPLVSSIADETCGDAVDQDCDGVDLAPVDVDADTFVSAAACANGDDCNDNNAAINPSVDADGDGSNVCLDCNDNPGIGAFLFPGNPEVCGDGIDQDCSGLDDVADVDGDGWNGPNCQGTDCDDSDASLNPGLDADNDGFSSCDDCDDGDAALGSNADPDGDGSPNCLDCAPTDPLVYPGAAELCDDIDSDCDGLPDGQDGDIGLPSQPAQTFGPGVGGFFPDILGGGPLVGLLQVSGGPPTILDVDIELSAAYFFFPGNVSLITVDLTSPQGTTVSLIAGVGPTSGTGFNNVVLDDEAAQPLSAGSDPFAGTFQPTSPLSAFDGENPNGTWTIEVNGDPLSFGEVAGWSILFPGLDPDDADGDGWTDTCGDCDAADVTIHPGAPEICGDGIDQDCSGADAPGDLDNDTYLDDVCGGPDCDPSDPLVNPGVDADGDGSNMCLDCDDDDATLVPGNTETCGDGIDQNCDGIDQPTDADGDAYIDLVCGGDDCDSTDPLVNPGADQDGDGSHACIDCEDSDPDVYPGAVDVCNGQDEDCDGTPDNKDVDLDLWFGCGGGDCDDEEFLANPGLVEVCDDGIDNDCEDGELIGDADGDGHQTAICDGEDCDDNYEDIYPGAPEGCDGIDHDCDGLSELVDADGDTFGDAACGGPDCDDTLSSVHPGVGELCNGLDDNCDGVPAAGGEDDADGDGAWSCDDCDDEDPTLAEGFEELCDDLDNDCDGIPDDGVIKDGDGDGFERESCGGEDCFDSSDAVFPGAVEDCADDVDNDCDATTDLDDEDCAGLRNDCGGCDTSRGPGGREAGPAALALGVLALGRRRRKVQLAL
jgi:hypothetical protein